MSMLRVFNSTYPNGIDILTPISFGVSIADLDSEETKRSGSGLLDRKIIRKRIRSIEVSWGLLSQEAAYQLINLFNSDTSFTTNLYGNSSYSVPKGFFALEYPDPYVNPSTNPNGITKRVFYAGDRNTPMKNFTKRQWEQLSLSFVER